MDIKEIQKRLKTAILDADRQAANQIIAEWAGEHGYADSITHILEPTLVRIGLLWDKSGDLSLAQGYVAGKIAEDIMISAAAEKHPEHKETKKGPVVVGNIEDDYHALGRRLVATFLRASGWEVHDLGNDVPADEFVEAAIDTEARVIGVSAMMYTTAMNISEVRKEIDDRGLTGKIQLAVGGAVFKLRPDLVKEVGGDGTTGTAIYAPPLMEKLWRKSVDIESGC